MSLKGIWSERLRWCTQCYANIRPGECDADGEDGAGFERQQVEQRNLNQR